MDYDQLHDDLIRDEGWRARPYTDTVGKLTIGVGFNLSDRDLPDDVIELLLERDMRTAVEIAERFAAEAWDNLSPVRQRVLANMAFNLGEPRLGGFRRFRAAVRAGRHLDAAREMRSSQW